VVRVTVEAPVKPTEDEAKVRAAASQFFPGGAVLHLPGRLVVETHDLVAFRKRVWELRIIDTVRAKLLRGLSSDGRSLRFALSKQAAAGGKVSFPPTPHALGDLEVRFDLEPSDLWTDAEKLAWWLCPETKDGEIVGPT
jgi:predicted RNA binding protein with dsRBD fold (UPF0201 family)